MAMIDDLTTIDEVKKAYEDAKDLSKSANASFREVIGAPNKPAAEPARDKAVAAAVNAWGKFLAGFTAAIKYLNSPEETAEARDLVEKIRNEAAKAETAALEAVDLCNKKRD